MTEGAATAVYGVVLADGVADAAATAVRRTELLDARRARTSGSTSSGEGVQVDLTTARRVDDNLVVDGAQVACGHCDHQLADLGVDSALRLARYEGPSSDAGPQVLSDPSRYVDDEFVFRHLCCPACMTAVYSGGDVAC